MANSSGQASQQDANIFGQARVAGYQEGSGNTQINVFAAQNELIYARLKAGLPGYGSTMTALIRDKTAGFCGRQNVFSAIEKFISENDRGYFCIQGDPGAGKTAILAEYARRTASVAHFNVASQGICTTGQFYTSLIEQSKARFPNLVPNGIADTSNLGVALNAQIEAMRSEAPDGDPLVVVVDALDEAAQNEPNSPNVLLLPPTPPPGVYFIVSSRRSLPKLRVESPVQRFDLSTYHSETLQDITDYLHLIASTPQFMHRFPDRAVQVQTVEELLLRSEGNFMYLRYVIPELLRDGTLQAQELPFGLQSYYEDHWIRMGMAQPSKKIFQLWTIYLLCEIARPASSELIASILEYAGKSAEAFAVQDVLHEWRQFMHRQSRATGSALYSIYHSSFQGFLRASDIVEGAGLTLHRVHEAIADAMWDEETRRRSARGK